MPILVVCQNSNGHFMYLTKDSFAFVFQAQILIQLLKLQIFHLPFYFPLSTIFPNRIAKEMEVHLMNSRL